ncbi:SCO1431 family membrane protein [Streptomyces sp. SAJ15]|nr:SCO1431 family membrane protein [Streptomyces sp. SAJ15]
MSDIAAPHARRFLPARTGGPSDGRLEHLAGWTLTVVVAMLAVQLGLV